MTDIERPSITEVYEYYDLRILGHGTGWQKAQCPRLDHEDANPSASINEDIGKWRCWSCDSKGDGIDIVQEREALAGPAEAIKLCQERFRTGNGSVPGEPMGRGGLSRRPGNRSGGSHFVPIWRRGL